MKIKLTHWDEKRVRCCYCTSIDTITIKDVTTCYSCETRFFTREDGVVEIKLKGVYRKILLRR